MSKLSRRNLLIASAIASCTQRAALADDTGVGYIYVGAKIDHGYNENHALAAQQVAKLPNVRLVEQEKVPESDAVASVMEAMIVEENCSVLFPTSWGYYDPYILRLAKKYPEVVFLHCGGAWKSGDPENVCSYFGHMHEGQHLAGIAAAYKAPTGKLGFVASNRYPGVIRNINSFALGTQLVNPNVTIQLVFTGSWSDPVREAEAVNTLVDQGVEVVGCSVDSPRTVVETAERRNVYACGYNASAVQFGPSSYITSTLANWSAHNVAAVELVQQGNRPENFYSGGLAENLIMLDPQSNLDTEQTEHIEMRRQEIITGRKKIWHGPIVDHEGVERVAPNTTLAKNDPLLRRMDWFVRGVRV